jgi:hypothetical protein
VPLSRKQLVAEWRSRLAATEEIPAGAVSRPAWLVRVQRRLYQFLLSLYGNGDWRTTDLPDSPPVVEIGGEQSVVFDAPGVWPLAGKPAKETGKIRAVLKAVATAQDEPLPAGPLVDCLPAEDWVTVAVVKRGIEPNRCVKLLGSRQFTVRVLGRGADLSVEVPAREHQAALKLLAAQKRREMDSRPEPVQPLADAIFWTTLAVTFAPIPAFPALVIARSQYPDALAGQHTGEAALYALALFAAFSSIAFVRPIAQLILTANRLVMRAWAILKQRLFRKQ